MKIGFVGLGIMGKPMVRNLLKAGYEVVVYDIIQKNIDEVVSCGATSAQSNKEVAESCDGIMITMLPNSPHVKTVVLGENGLLEGAKSGYTLIDMSSIEPKVSQEIFAACDAKGVDMLDAPVSGGEPKAIDGTMAIMVGGKKTIFEKNYDILMVMGGSATYCGDIGSGNTTKLTNQIIVAANIAALAEGMMLASMNNVDPNLVFNAIKNGLAGSTVMNAKAPMMIAQDFKPGFKIDLHIKDLNNVLSSGHDVGSPLPITAIVMEMFQTLRADGCGQDDHSALLKYYQKLTGKVL